MSTLAFKYFTIQAGGTPQPLIGSYLTAALSAATVNAAIQQQGNIQLPVSLTVNDSSMFIGGQYVNIIDPSTFFTEGLLRIYSVPDSTHVQVVGVQKSHPGGAYGTGSWVALQNLGQQIYVQSLDGNAGSLFIGTSPQMVKSSGAFVIAKMVKVATGTQPVEFSTSRQGLSNTEMSAQYWIDGTTGDSYLPSLGQV